MVGVEVQRTNTETNVSLMRRFTKRVQGSGNVRRAKSMRYRSRALSALNRHKRALKRITRHAHTEHLRKWGKLDESARRQSH